MGVFEQFPYSNYHDLNLDWILTEIKRLSDTVATYDDHLAHLDSEIVRVEGEIPDVVQGPGYRTDAVMSQKAVTDIFAVFGGVRSIENYHQELGRLTPVRFFADQVYRFDEGHVGEYVTEQGASSARYHIDDAEAPHVIFTSGYDDPSDTQQLAAAAAFDVEIPTSSTTPLEIWTVPASESDYEISVDLPGGTVCVLVNSFTNSDPGMAKVLSGVWEWDGQPDNSVGTAALINGAVTAGKIADGAVFPSKLATNAVGETAIQDGAVTAGKIANNAVTTDKIAATAVTDAKLASNAVTEAKLASNAVTEGKIADSAVTTAKIASSAVTSAKLASDSVTAAKIADGAVRSSAFSAAARAPGVQIETTIPAESMADNGYKITVLDSEPATKYPGWVYMIKGTPAQGLPAASAADNGKVLGVVNGAWAKRDNVYVMNAFAEWQTAFMSAATSLVQDMIANPNTLIRKEVSVSYNGDEIVNAVNAMKEGKQVYVPSLGLVLANGYDEANGTAQLSFPFNVDRYQVAANTFIGIVGCAKAYHEITSQSLVAFIAGLGNTVS